MRVYMCVCVHVCVFSLGQNGSLFCLCNGHPAERALLVTVGVEADWRWCWPHPGPGWPLPSPGPGGPLQGTRCFVLQGRSQSGAEQPRACQPWPLPPPLPRHFAHSKAVLEAAAHLILFNAHPRRCRCASVKGCSLNQSASEGLMIPSPWALTPGPRASDESCISSCGCCSQRWPPWLRERG